jgi:hypothetical protein
MFACFRQVLKLAQIRLSQNLFQTMTHFFTLEVWHSDFVPVQKLFSCSFRLIAEPHTALFWLMNRIIYGPLLIKVQQSKSFGELKVLEDSQKQLHFSSLFDFILLADTNYQ